MAAAPLAARRLLPSLVCARHYATGSAPSTLLFIEHRGGKLNPGVGPAIAAAQKLGGDITGIVTGAENESLSEVVEQIKMCAVGRSRVI
jgi:electron transfer flavoprotein alpha subunit